MGQILKDIYTDVSLAPLLGLKGGTSAYFFYGLPRFSVDLNFDLFDVNEKKWVFKKIIGILRQYGEIKDQYIKRYTVFALLSYGIGDRNIKVEINIRKAASSIRDHYELKEYLGISMLAARKDYLFAGKLAALTSRKETAMRDIYDIHYFAKNHWDINEAVIRERTGKNIKKYLADCIACIEKVPRGGILQGLGELVSEKEKTWVRNHLKTEAIFMLRNYLAALG